MGACTAAGHSFVDAGDVDAAGEDHEDEIPLEEEERFFHVEVHGGGGGPEAGEARDEEGGEGEWRGRGVEKSAEEDHDVDDEGEEAESGVGGFDVRQVGVLVGFGGFRVGGFSVVGREEVCKRGDQGVAGKRAELVKRNVSLVLGVGEVVGWEVDHAVRVQDGQDGGGDQRFGLLEWDSRVRRMLRVEVPVEFDVAVEGDEDGGAKVLPAENVDGRTLFEG